MHVFAESVAVAAIEPSFSCSFFPHPERRTYGGQRQVMAKSHKSLPGPDRRPPVAGFPNEGQEQSRAALELKILVQQLCDEEKTTRGDNVRRIVPYGQPAVKLLLKLFDVKSTLTFANVAWALGEIGPSAVEAIPDLVRKLRQRNAPAATRASAAWALGMIGDSDTSIAALLDACRDSERLVRQLAVIALHLILNAVVPDPLLPLSRAELAQKGYDEIDKVINEEYEIEPAAPAQPAHLTVAAESCHTKEVTDQSKQTRNDQVHQANAETRALTPDQVRSECGALGERLVAIGDADYPTAHRALVDISRDFREIIAKVLEPKFNSVLQRIPQDNYEEKRMLCRWRNAQLAELGIAEAVPEEGKSAAGFPARVLAGSDGKSQRGRFEYEIEEEGHRRRIIIQKQPRHTNLVSASHLPRASGSAAVAHFLDKFLPARRHR